MSLVERVLIEVEERKEMRRTETTPDKRVNFEI